MERLTLSAREVQQALGLSRSMVYKALAEGTLPSVRIGMRILIPRSALDSLLAEAKRPKPKDGTA